MYLGEFCEYQAFPMSLGLRGQHQGEYQHPVVEKHSIKTLSIFEIHKIIVLKLKIIMIQTTDITRSIR